MKKAWISSYGSGGLWALLLCIVSMASIVNSYSSFGFGSGPVRRTSIIGSRREKTESRALGFRARSNSGRLPTLSTPRTTATISRRADQTTSTQLGLDLVLPLPITVSPRLSGQALRVAESWAPSVGVLTSTLLYLAPANAVWGAIQRARKLGLNGDDEYEDPMEGLNPLPIAIMPSVALSWLVYGLASSDPYLILGNLPGTLISVAYLIFILPIMNYNATIFPTLPNLGIDNKISETNSGDGKTPKNRRTKPRMSKMLLLVNATVLLSTASTLGLWAVLGLMTAGATDGLFHIGGLEFGMGFSSMARSGVLVQSLGVYAASLFILLSGSPLSMIRTVIKTKNSKTILGRLTAAFCVNTGLWTAYGLAVNDHFVWGPNIIGLSLGLIQLTLKILYPTKKRVSRKRLVKESTLLAQ